MVYELKQCRTAEVETERKTTVEITKNNNEVTFVFNAQNCKYYCPHSNYNDLHSQGDIVEILIGSDPDRKTYYEIEVSPENNIMLAKMSYLGETEKGPKLGIDFVPTPFIKTDVKVTGSNYVATVTIPLNKIITGDGEVFFNAYRIDTDGGKFLKEEMYLLALNPTMRGKFHTPKYFLKLSDYVK